MSLSINNHGGHGVSQRKPQIFITPWYSVYSVVKSLNFILFQNSRLGS